MPSIGSIDCFRVIGVLPAPKQKLAVWTVPGVNGYGAQQFGLQDQPFEVTAVLYGDLEGVISWKNQLCGVQGSIVTIVNDHGESIANCLVEEVTPGKMEAALNEAVTQRAEARVKGCVRA